MPFGLFRPREVLEAEHYLQQGNPRAAAHVLLQAGQSHHKDVVECKKKVAQQLMAVARREYQSGGLLSAHEAIELARQLGPLNAEDAVFVEEISRKVEEYRYKRESLDKLEQQAREWLSQRQYLDVVRLVENFLRGLKENTLRAAEARLLSLVTHARTSIQKLEELLQAAERALESGQLDLAQQILDGELARLAPEQDYRCEQLRKRLQAITRSNELQRLKQSIRQALQGDDLPRLLSLWRRAVELAPEDDQEMQQLTQAVLEKEQSLEKQKRVVAIRQREHTFVLGSRWLVISLDQITIGVRNKPGVNLPLLGQLHSRHVRIWRDRGRYFLVPCLDKSHQPCRVYVNGALVREQFTLQSGDCISLDNPSCPGSLTFRFLQPVSDSGTAILQANQSSASRIAAGVPACSDAIFLDDEIVLSPRPGARVHIVCRHLPCTFRLVWTNEGLKWEIQGGQASFVSDDPSCATTSGLVLVPSELYLSAEVSDTEQSEAEWLREQFQKARRSSTHSGFEDNRVGFTPV